MNTSRKLKIWTIVCHGIITILAGHGVVFLFVIEILTFPYLTKENFSFSLKAVDGHLPVIGFLTFLGQAALLFSILQQKQTVKNLSQIIGLCSLWMSVIYFIYDTSRNNYVPIALLTVVPFAICTIITFTGQRLKRLSQLRKEV